MMQSPLRANRHSFGKDCRVLARCTRGKTHVKLAADADRSTLTRMRATPLGTPISRLAGFAAVRRPRPAPSRHPHGGPHPHLIREGFGRLAVGAESGHLPSLPCPLTTPIGKVFQLLYSAFPPR